MVVTQHSKPNRCTKVRYRDKIGALYALAVIRGHDNASRPKTEQRAYYCYKCAGFHLTSMGGTR
jgi:hypothetical protein